MPIHQTRKFVLSMLVALLLLAYARAGNALDCRTHRERSRPIPLGVAGGNLDSLEGGVCCSGTLGSLVQDSGGNQFILSNNHVLATANDAQNIIQPGLAELNCNQSRGAVVADSVNFIPLSRSGNVADAAIAEVVSGDVDPTGKILNIGNIAAGGAIAPRINLKVRKMGATSCITRGTVIAVEATIAVRYPKRTCNLTFGGTAIFQHQLQISGGGFSRAGDSGSLVVTRGKCPRAVGLVVAGSNRSTFASPMQPILQAFNVTMVGKNCAAAQPSVTETTAELVASTLATPPAGGSASATSQAATSSSVTPQAREVRGAAAIKERHEPELMSLPGVVGTAIGAQNGHPVIKVFVEKDTPAVRAAIPPELEGIPVEIEETGRIEAY